jgi:GNAT superfamily N-acetyltransferase
MSDIQITQPDGSSADLWITDTPSYQGGRVGAIGKLQAPDAAAASELLEACCAALKNAGCHWAVGPMDGNTWHSYRVVQEMGALPLFLGEPKLSPQWADWFPQAGFEIIAHYTSSRTSLTEQEGQEKILRAESRLTELGVTFRSLRLDEWEVELERIHRVSLAAFTGAFLYTPISLESFLQLYAGIKALANPQWIRIAEWNGAPVGFVFTFDAGPIGPERPLFVKTLAVVPDRRLAGLGSVLLHQVQSAAAAAGFTCAIHCLQHESNTSLRVSSRYQPTVVRRYALFGRKLSV